MSLIYDDIPDTQKAKVKTVFLRVDFNQTIE